MPSPLQRTFKDLEAIQVIKRNVERIDRLRDDFMKESNKCHSEECFLNDAEQEMDQLRVEEQVMIEEMRQINSDINALESARKNAEEEKRRSHNNAKRLLNEMRQLKHETNELCKDVQHEPLPEPIVNPEDEIKFQSSTNHNQSFFSIGHSHWPLSIPYSSPFTEALQRQNPAPPLSIADDWGSCMNDLNGQNLMTSPTAGRIAASSSNQMANSSYSMSNNSKQQPPMKTCASCQREIHRNAPICPICKAKSKSKHPKKPHWRGKSRKTP